MWLFDRRLALTALLATAACGFEPAFAPGNSGDQLRGQILVDTPQDREDFNFVTRLEDRLGRNGAAPLLLSYDITTSRDGVAITADQQTQRFNLVGQVTYEVEDQASGAVLTSGTVSSFTSYSTTGTTVATQAAEDDAYERLIVILADQLITRLIATGDGWLP
ncbi:MAG: LPS assembly lipoprotein LptE [Pseudomonadota bacterium]